MKRAMPCNRNAGPVAAIVWATFWGGAACGDEALMAEALTIDGVILSALVEAETPAQVVGVVDRIAVVEGATVEAGALLAQLDEHEAHLAVERARIERDQAQLRAANRLRVELTEKSLAVAEAELRRSLESVAQFAQSVSQSQLDVERLTVQKLQTEMAQAEHEQALDQFDLQLKENALRTAQRQLELRSIRAPFAGVVSLIRARPGEWVEPGAPVCRLVAVATLRAEAFVDAALVDRVQLGDVVQFALDDDSLRSYSGTLRYRSPESDPVTGQTRVWAEIDNRAGRLRPGMHGRLERARAHDGPPRDAARTAPAAPELP